MTMWGLCTGVYRKRRVLLAAGALVGAGGLLTSFAQLLVVSVHCSTYPAPGRTPTSHPAPRGSTARGREGSQQPCGRMVCRTLSK